MNNITFFEGDSQQEDLPWGKDWAKTKPDPSIPHEVITIYSGDKGLLLETTEYKVFIFRRQKEYHYLLEALQVWVDGTEPIKPLICAYLNKKSLRVGINHDGKDVTWMQQDNKFVSRRVEPSLTPEDWGRLNPFLAPRTPPMDAGTSARTGKPPKPKNSNSDP